MKVFILLADIVSVILGVLLVCIGVIIVVLGVICPSFLSRMSSKCLLYVLLDRALTSLDCEDMRPVLVCGIMERYVLGFCVGGVAVRVYRL